jgi:hypothetical protein
MGIPGEEEMRGRRKQHDWNYMGVDKETHVEYGFCALCGKYRYCLSGNGFTFISKKFYMDRFIQNKVEIR